MGCLRTQKFWIIYSFGSLKVVRVACDTVAVLYCHVYFLSARNIKIVKALQNVSVTERESVTFICEVNWEDVDGKWYKDDSRLRAGDNIKIRCEGMCERLSNTLTGGLLCTFMGRSQNMVKNMATYFFFQS